MASSLELAAMRRAVALSAHGLGTTSPNPPVGCVILDTEGRIVGEGYHQRKGEPHAEVNALMAAGDHARGGTAVVTLEPCNHVGRTPACHQALLDAGIRRVVVALIDPTSRGEGGVKRLRDADVDVEIDVLADEARLVLGPWLTALQTKLPRVIWPVAYVAGALLPLAANDHPTCDTEWQRLRHAADAVLAEGGHVIESIRGTHGPNTLHLEPQSSSTTPHAALRSLYDGGVRTLLLNGGRTFAAPFLDDQLIDEVLICQFGSGTSAVPQSGSALDELTLPPAFVLVDVAKLDDMYVRMTMR